MPKPLPLGRDRHQRSRGTPARRNEKTDNLDRSTRRITTARAGVDKGNDII
jgi:hypothetical protein